MANNLRKFETEVQYTAATLSYPAVSWVTGTDAVHFDKVAPIPQDITLTYNIVDTTSEVGIWNGAGSHSAFVPATMKVDGTEVTPVNSYRFLSTGEHTVELVLQNNSTSIPNGTFSGKTMTEIEIGGKTSVIGDDAFKNCTSLTSATIGADDLYYNIFEGCTMLQDVTIESASYITRGMFKGCTSLTNIVMPSAREIDEAAFEGCTSLASITIPSGVTTIGENAFSGCTSLASITFPSNGNLTEIESNAFRNCTSLTNVTIPSGVTTISDAFRGCTNLATMTCLPTTPPDSHDLALPSNISIYVPAAAVDDYKGAPAWDYYEENIQAIPE